MHYVSVIRMTNAGMGNSPEWIVWLIFNTFRICIFIFLRYEIVYFCYVMLIIFLIFLCCFYEVLCCFQVEKKRQEDAANGVKIAKDLEGFVERKVSIDM